MDKGHIEQSRGDYRHAQFCWDLVPGHGWRLEDLRPS